VALLERLVAGLVALRLAVPVLQLKAASVLAH
jgi:hypothetical protein